MRDLSGLSGTLRTFDDYSTDFYMSVFKTGRIMVYQCPTVRPSVSHVSQSYWN
jgi:hypothetical protein